MTKSANAYPVPKSLSYIIEELDNYMAGAYDYRITSIKMEKDSVVFEIIEYDNRMRPMSDYKLIYDYNEATLSNQNGEKLAAFMPFF